MSKPQVADITLPEATLEVLKTIELRCYPLLDADNENFEEGSTLTLRAIPVAFFPHKCFLEAKIDITNNFFFASCVVTLILSFEDTSLDLEDFSVLNAVVVQVGPDVVDSVWAEARQKLRVVTSLLDMTLDIPLKAPEMEPIYLVKAEEAEQ